MPRRIFSHEDLCKMVESEPDPQDEWSQRYREWKQEELEDLWQELKRIEAIHLRRIQNRKIYMERLLGMRLKARAPRKVLDLPASIARAIGNS